MVNRLNPLYRAYHLFEREFVAERSIQDNILIADEVCFSLSPFPEEFTEDGLHSECGYVESL